MKLPDAWTRATPMFDDENLVSFAGLAPVMALAELAKLSQLIEARVRFWSTKIASAGVNPAGKLSSIIAGMAAGADCIDNLDALRAGGMKQVFGGVYAAATLGQLLREFTHGHSLQLASVARAHLVGLARDTDLLPGIGTRAFVDIESFFATLKTEFYYRRVWPTQARARLEVGAWIEDRYNRRRRHSALGQTSPVQFELQHCNHPAADLHAA